MSCNVHRLSLVKLSTFSCVITQQTCHEADITIFITSPLGVYSAWVGWIYTMDICRMVKIGFTQVFKPSRSPSPVFTLHNGTTADSHQFSSSYLKVAFPASNVCKCHFSYACPCPLFINQGFVKSYQKKELTRSTFKITWKDTLFLLPPVYQPLSTIHTFVGFFFGILGHIRHIKFQNIIA